MSDIENKQISEKASHGDFKHDSCVIASFNNKLKLKINKFDCEIRIEILQMNMEGSTVSGDFGRNGFSIYPHSPALEINKFSFHFSSKYPKFNIPCSFRFDSNEQRDQYITVLSNELDVFCSDKYFWESHKEKNLKQAKNLAISTKLANEFNETMKMQSLTRELEKEIKRLKEANKLLDKDLDKVEDTLSDTMKINNELDKTNLLLNNKIVDLENEQKALETLIIELHNKIYHLNNKNTELMNENASLIKSFNKSSIESDNRKIIELQTTIGSLKVQLFESKNEFNRVSKEYECLDWELKEIQHSLKLYKKSDKELREQIIEVKEINNNLYNKLNDLPNLNSSFTIAKEKATNVLYKKSNEVFGNKHIFEQTIEEMAELMVEINKVRRVNEGFDLTKINNLPQIMEEVCDVQMCLNHLKILFNEADFKNIQIKKFDKFTDHFKRQFNKKENEKKLNDLTNNLKGVEP